MADNIVSKKAPLNNVERMVLSYRMEARDAKQERMDQNEENWRMFNLKQDFSHKIAGQSTEVIPKQSTAIEQTTAFFHQGLIKKGKDWYKVKGTKGVSKDESVITIEEHKILLDRQLEKTKFETHIADVLKAGQIESLMISKVGGCIKETLIGLETTIVEGEEVLQRQLRDVWQLDISQVRAEDFFPDTSGSKRFVIERIEMDLDELMFIAKKNDKFFILDMIKMVPHGGAHDQDHKKTVEKGENQLIKSDRKRIEVWEFWGDIADPTTGESLHRNVHCFLNTDGHLISHIEKNKLWHNKHPYVFTPIIRVPRSTWHKALADTSTKLNIAYNELFNLTLDSAMMSAFGIKQVREDWLEDPEEISDGISPGMTLRANSSTPPGGKVVEAVVTSDSPIESSNMLGLLEKEHNQAALTSDTRLGGTSQRKPLATEVVSQNQSLNAVFSAIAGIIETEHIQEVLDKSWLLSAQHMDDFSLDEVKGLLGTERANIINSKSKAKIYAETALGRKYKVFGLTAAANNLIGFRNLAMLLQTIASSPQIAAEFQTKFSITKILTEILDSLSIDKERIKADEDEVRRGTMIAEALANNAQAGETGGLRQGASGNTPGAAKAGSDQITGDGTSGGGLR